MVKIILAVIVRLFLIAATNILTGLIDGLPALVLATRFILVIVAGYVAALISKRAPIIPTLAIAIICAAISIGSIKSEYGNWLTWMSGNFGAAILVTWGGLFRKWQITENLQHQGKINFLRSVLAIGSGFFVYMFYGFVTGSFSQSVAFTNESSSFILLGLALTQLIAGYVTAFICKHAPIKHILAMAALCMAVPVVIRIFTGVHYDWGRWFVGALTMIVYMTWSGFFRILQFQRRNNAAPQIIASTSPAA
jgi:hypothetical protein